MESERKTKIITLSAVIVAVIGLTIAFAAMSRTLRINGTGTMDPVNWDIYFENIKLKSDTDPSSVTGNPTPTTGNTAATINNLNVTLKNPGDTVVWTADITNNGSVNAEIQSFSLTPNLTNELLDVEVKYTNIYEHEHTITVGDMLYAGETRNITITFKYKDITDENQLPKNSAVVIDNLSYQIVYVQSNKVSTTTTTAPVVNNCTSFETKSTYSVGDTIALCNSSTGKSEDFYVISDNGETVTALAKYNLLVGNVYEIDNQDDWNEVSNEPISSSVDGYGLQNSSAKGYVEDGTVFTGVLAFAEDNNNGYGYWYNTSTHNLDSNYGNSYPAWVFNSNSNLWTPVGNYQTYLTATLGKTSATATLMSQPQAVGLGCSKNDCNSAPSWVYSSSYWLGSACTNDGVWCVFSNGDFYGFGFRYDDSCGVRPVITISKSDL